VTGKRRFFEHRRFLALRACWEILRNGSVAWNINFTEGGFDSIGRHDTFIAGCQMDGRPLTAWDIEHAKPEQQPE
jgi:hypothetical protein